MKRTLSLLSLLLVANLYVAAQSGRRIVSQPAPQPVAAPAPEAPSSYERPAADVPASRGASGLAFVPEAVMTREMRALKGSSFRLADFAGSVVVLNLWATWCGPCRREMPEFEDVRREYAGRGVEFIALTTENPESEAEKVGKFVRDFKLGSRIGWIDRQTASILMDGRNVIPQTIVVSGDGQVVRHMRGYAPRRSAEQLRQAIERALEN